MLLSKCFNISQLGLGCQCFQCSVITLEYAIEERPSLLRGSHHTDSIEEV